MLECTVQDGGERTLLGLNDIVIHSDPPLHMIEIELAIDGEPVATFRGDGLILSTPIGSTAHNLAAGGPILRQELPAFVITPICAHALTYRPLVDDAERTFSIALHRASHPARLIVDGQEHLPIAAGQRITVKRAAVKFKRIRVPGHSYYATLQEKLQWAAPPNYRTGHSHHP
jgi:NAD+ kinase